MKSKYYTIISAIYLLILMLGAPLAAAYMNITLHEIFLPLICEGSSSTVILVVEGMGDPIPLDVVFAIDYSGSINDSDRTNGRLEATKKFINYLDPARDRAGLICWNETIIDSRSVDLTNNFNDIISKLDADISGVGVLPSGDTNFDTALNASINMFEKDNGNNKKCIIFLSDGLPEPIDRYIPTIDPESQANRAKEEGIEIWTVGFSIDEKGEIILKEIANITDGLYYPAINLTVEDVFVNIYRNMTRLAGEDVTIRYLTPSNLSYSIQDFDIEGNNKEFTWKPMVEDSSGPRNYFYIGEKWIKTFKVSSENHGIFTLGVPDSKMSYTVQNVTGNNIKIEEPIEEKMLLVVPCEENQSCNITKVKYIYFGDSYNITGTNLIFGNGSIYYNCTPSPGPDGEPSKKIVCECSSATCPECASAPSDDASKVNNINIVQNAIFGSTPYWNGTDEPTGVINLTVSRPDAAIDALLAFDVSGSMRLPYEGMDAEDRAAFAEANFSNVSIIGWDEDGAGGAGSGADLLMVPPRPLMESREDVLAAIANLSGLCGESDQTVYAAGLRGSWRSMTTSATISAEMVRSSSSSPAPTSSGPARTSATWQPSLSGGVTRYTPSASRSTRSSRPSCTTT